MPAIFPMLSHQKCSEKPLNSDSLPCEMLVAHLWHVSYFSLSQQSRGSEAGWWWGHAVKLSISVITLTPNTDASINRESIDVTVRRLTQINLNLHKVCEYISDGLDNSLFSHTSDKTQLRSLQAFVCAFHRGKSQRSSGTLCYDSRAWDVEVSHFSSFLCLSFFFPFLGYWE